MAGAGAVGQGTGRGRLLPEAGGLLRVALVLLVLNLLDGLFTLGFLRAGVADELNPLMRAAYRSSPAAFMLVKLGVVHAGVLVLFRGRAHRSARAALWAGLALYAAIVAYHLAFLARLWAG